MNGKKLTAEQRLERRARWWRERRRAATTPAMQASRAWDQLSSDIGRMPAGERDAVWLAVADALDEVAANLTPRQVVRSGGQRTDATRARTRGNERNTSTKGRTR